MKARYQYRFYPTNQQRRSLAQLFGCVRLAWNDALALSKFFVGLPNYHQLSGMLTSAKKTENRESFSNVSYIRCHGFGKSQDVVHDSKSAIS
jgi:putative transposase